MKSRHLCIIFTLIITACSNGIKIHGNINKLSNDKKTGLWVQHIDSTNQIEFIFYKNGLKHGRYIIYHSNGQVAIQGYYKDDKENRLWKKYLFNGTLISKTLYYNGNILMTKRSNIVW